MTFHLLDQSGASLRDAIQGRVPPGARLLPDLDGGGQKTESAGSQNEPRQYLVQKRVALGDVNDAQPLTNAPTSRLLLFALIRWVEKDLQMSRERMSIARSLWCWMAKS